jgi:hypothetical protein
MTKKTLHKACEVIFAIAIVNFLLFFVISLLIGGDGLNGKVENGHYFLGGGGQHTEVSYIVFTYSRFHALSVFITHPLAMLAAAVFWVTGGKVTWKAVTKTVKEPPRHPVLRALHIIESFLWRISDCIEGVFWVLLDSWRKPGVEFFTTFSRKECIVRLSEALDQEPSFYRLKKPVGGYLSGTHFYLLKQRQYNIFYRNSVLLTLFGKFVSTPHGTYVRAWHRFSSVNLLFFIVWLGMAITMITAVILGTMYPSPPFPLFGGALPMTVAVCGIIPLIIVTFALLLIWISSVAGKRRNADLAHFLRQVLANEIAVDRR